MCTEEPRGLFLFFWVELWSSLHRKEQLNVFCTAPLCSFGVCVNRRHIKFTFCTAICCSKKQTNLEKTFTFFFWISKSPCRVKSNVLLVAHYHFRLQLTVPPKFIRTALSRAGFIRQQLARDNSSRKLPDKTAASMCVYNTCKLTARLSHIISHLLEKTTLQSGLINYLGVCAKSNTQTNRSDM